MANALGYVSTDLEASYEGELDMADDEWYQEKLDEAVRLLLRKVPKIQARMAAYDPDKGTGIDPKFVKDKVVGAVLRVLRLPDPGYKSENEGNYSYEVNPVEASANIWFTKDELADLGVGAVTAMPRTVFASNRYGWP